MDLRSDALPRGVTDVGAGDFVKIGSRWKQIESNSAEGASHTPRSWTVRTTDGMTYGMWGIRRYAKAEDLSS